MQISPMTRTLYLWTKRGAARHAKMLSTDRARDVFELLEDTYFNREAVDKLLVSIADLILSEEFLSVPERLGKRS